MNAAMTKAAVLETERRLERVRKAMLFAPRPAKPTDVDAVARERGKAPFLCRSY